MTSIRIIRTLKGNHILKYVLLIVVFSIAHLQTQGQNVLFEVDGSIKIGDSNSSNPDPGSIRFRNGNFEGWNGLTWVALGKFKLAGTVTDLDGNTYQTIQIGDQEWMAENLRVTQYTDGTTMSYQVGQYVLIGTGPGYRYYYDDKAANAVPYGALYTWQCVETNKLCPTGWKVPSNTDWQRLEDNLGGQQIAGAHMKEGGFEHWLSPNTGACNDSGFTARGAGMRDVNTLDFIELHEMGYWWSSSASGADPYVWWNEHDEADLTNVSTNSQNWGFSVRCLKN